MKSETITVGQEVIIKVGEQKGQKGVIFDTNSPNYLVTFEPHYLVAFGDVRWWYWRSEFDLVED